jgi:hypothetical protein
MYAHMTKSLWIKASAKWHILLLLLYIHTRSQCTFTTQCVLFQLLVRFHSPVRHVPAPHTRPEMRVTSPVPPVPITRIRPPVHLHSPVRPVPLPRTRPEVCNISLEPPETVYKSKTSNTSLWSLLRCRHWPCVGLNTGIHWFIRQYLSRPDQRELFILGDSD